MRRSYLIYAFTAFIAWIILDKMGYQFKWAALGFGVVMLLLGIFMKDKVIVTEAEIKAEEVIDEINKMGENQDLNKIGGQNYDI